MRRTRASLAILTIVVGAGLAPAQGVDLGSLTITIDPDTSILWDGHPLGTVDESGLMEIAGIPPGTYSITLRRAGLEDVVQTLEIVAGAQQLKRPASVPAVLPASAPTETTALDDGSKRPASVPADPALPDPFAKRTTPFVSIAFVAFLVAIAMGALYLGRRRRMEPDEDIPVEPEGPKVVMAEPSAQRRPPGFYEDLRQRETVLESFEDRGPNRPRPKVIELPVVDHRSVEEEG